MAKDKPMKDQSNEDLRDFDNSLPMALLRAREAVMNEFIPLLRDNALSPEQWRVIRALNQEDGLELTELSRRCYLLAPSLSRIARKLEERQIVERRNVKTDQRRATLYLTESGTILFNKIAPESQRRYANISDKFGYEKLETLYEMLDELVASLK